MMTIICKTLKKQAIYDIYFIDRNIKQTCLINVYCYPVTNSQTSSHFIVQYYFCYHIGSTLF